MIVDLKFQFRRYYGYTFIAFLKMYSLYFLLRYFPATKFWVWKMFVKAIFTPFPSQLSFHSIILDISIFINLSILCSHKNILITFKAFSCFYFSWFLKLENVSFSNHKNAAKLLHTLMLWAFFSGNFFLFPFKNKSVAYFKSICFLILLTCVHSNFWQHPSTRCPHNLN